MIQEHVASVGLKLPGTTPNQFASQMEELRRLVETAGGLVVHEFTQNRDKMEPSTLLGHGKISEIAEEIGRRGLKTVVFNDNLSPAQQKNIEKMMKAQIIDRTRLILDIFAQRARTREGKLQVELAELNYMVPRLTGSWRGYSQQVGGIGGARRGPGEKKLEIERRYARERIKRLEVEIDEMRHHRAHIRESRESIPLPQAALVGYTNVGKSTLLNTLAGEPAVYADDKLFATLDPTTRRVKLPHGKAILFTDTVGFIQKLPPSLIAAFKSTLEELTRASLLVHLVDATAPERKEQEKIVLAIIKDLDADKIPLLTVYNKADLLSARELAALPQNRNTLLISGKTGEGIDKLLATIEAKLDKALVEVAFDLPHDKRKLLPQIYQTGYIVSEKPHEKGTKLKIRIAPENWKRLAHFLNGALK